MAAGHREAARSVLDGGEHGARLKRAGASAEEMTMRDTSLLQLALGLVPPWAVIRSEFDAEARHSTSTSTSPPAAGLLAPAAARRTALHTTPSR